MAQIKAVTRHRERKTQGHVLWWDSALWRNGTGMLFSSVWRFFWKYAKKIKLVFVCGIKPSMVPVNIIIIMLCCMRNMQYQRAHVSDPRAFIAVLCSRSIPLFYFFLDNMCKVSFFFIPFSQLIFYLCVAVWSKEQCNKVLCLRTSVCCVWSQCSSFARMSWRRMKALVNPARTSINKRWVSQAFCILMLIFSCSRLLFLLLLTPLTWPTSQPSSPLPADNLIFLGCHSDDLGEKAPSLALNYTAAKRSILHYSGAVSRGREGIPLQCAHADHLQDVCVCVCGVLMPTLQAMAWCWFWRVYTKLQTSAY